MKLTVAGSLEAEASGLLEDSLKPTIYTVDPQLRTKLSKGREVIRWIEGNCVFTDAEFVGQPFVLQEWQKRIIMALFAVDPETRLRLYRWALIGVPKKSGKSSLAAALALYMLLGDGEPSPLVVCAAASDEQADLVFAAAKTMCEMSPTLRAVTECFDKEILVPSLTGAKLRRVSASGGTQDGLNIHAVIIDEFHEFEPGKKQKTWEVLTNGTGARRQPLVIQITTAGSDLEGTVCGQQFTHCQAVAADWTKDPTYYVYWQQAPEGADHTDPRTWEAANPSYGVTVHEAFFRDQLTKKPKAVFERYFLNRWTLGAGDIWEVAALWDDLRADFTFTPELPVTVGIDVALKSDSTAVIVAQKQGTVTYITARIWENPYPPNHALHSTWRTPLTEVENHLLALYEQFPVSAREVDGEPVAGPAFFYDPHYFNQSAVSLMGDGLNMIEFNQTDARMIPACQVFYELCSQDRVGHDGDPDLARQIRNATTDDKGRGWRVSKPRGSRRKIDAAVAAVIAVSEAQHQNEQREPSKGIRISYA